MKKNLIFREILLYFLLIDIVFNLVLCITDCNILEYKFIQYVETVIRIILDHIFIFYLWYPVRYEEYSEKNPDSHILDWTFFLIAECVFCVVASGRMEIIYILSSLLLFIWIFVIYRYILLYKRGYQCSEQDMQGQIEKDIHVLLPMCGMYVFTVLGLCFIRRHTVGAGVIIAICTWVLSISIFLYCMHSIKHFICSEIHAKKVLTRMIYGTGVFLVVILGILASQSEMTGAGGIESIGVRIWFVLLETLLTLLFINSLAKKE